MLEDKIKSEKPIIITSAQKKEYFDDGAVLIEQVVSETWLKRIRQASDDIIERSKKINTV